MRDVKPSVDVIFGDNNIPYHAIGAVIANLNKSKDFYEYGTFSYDQYSYEVDTIPEVEEEVLVESMSDLNHHITNTRDWLDYKYSLPVPVSDIQVNVSHGTYEAPGCKLNVYYVTI